MRQARTDAPLWSNDVEKFNLSPKHLLETEGNKPRAASSQLGPPLCDTAHFVTPNLFELLC